MGKPIKSKVTSDSNQNRTTKSASELNVSSVKPSAKNKPSVKASAMETHVAGFHVTSFTHELS